MTSRTPPTFLCLFLPNLFWLVCVLRGRYGAFRERLRERKSPGRCFRFSRVRGASRAACWGRRSSFSSEIVSKHLADESFFQKEKVVDTFVCLWWRWRIASFDYFAPVPFGGFRDDGERAVPSLPGEISFIGGQEGQLAGPGAGSAAAETSAPLPLPPAYSASPALLHYTTRLFGLFFFFFFFCFFLSQTEQKAVCFMRGESKCWNCAKNSFLFPSVGSTRWAAHRVERVSPRWCGGASVSLCPLAVVRAVGAQPWKRRETRHTRYWGLFNYAAARRSKKRRRSGLAQKRAASSRKMFFTFFLLFFLLLLSKR